MPLRLTTSVFYPKGERITSPKKAHLCVGQWLEPTPGEDAKESIVDSLSALGKPDLGPVEDTFSKIGAPYGVTGDPNHDVAK